MNCFYTYFHTRNDTGKVFYIGKGKNKRAYDKNRNQHWKNIAAKHGYQVHFAMTELSEKEAHEHEMFLIACMRDIGVELCNMTNGGEGTTGFVHSEETKSKTSNALMGHPVSDETRAKISAASLGYKHTDEAKLKIKHASLGRSWPEKSKIEYSQSKRGIRPAHVTAAKMKEIQELAAAAVRGKPRALVECPHCGKVGGNSPMARWHFDKCPQRKINREKVNPYGV